MTTKLTFPCVEQEHYLFGKINRPVIRLALYSVRFGRWLEIGKVLADTGADISVVPLPMGQILIHDIENGVPMYVGGILSSSVAVNAFVHRITARIGDYTFEMPVAISVSSVIPPILGRQEALDRFSVSFIYGKEVIFEKSM
ncbi:MAG TPA: hypothetical protein DCQ37_05380 [Desulfobacteraceae bacterium]|jgi:hypothetical protein|nr:hypothetical protein [Desulfobacteraceae bacterium]